MEQPVFWADQLAEKVVEEFPEEEVYVAAAGITPSGKVHIGNFREIITVDLVVKALEERGEDVRFIYSWDDYDRFRKVPEGVPDGFEEHLGKPVSEVPDPEGCHGSYAEHFEDRLEEEIEPLGMDIEFVSQTEMFRSCEYADLMKKAMNRREEVREILNDYRTEPLEEDWYPLRVYCTECGKDFTEVRGYDGGYEVTYYCEECGEEREIDFSEEDSVKPPWRVDWPMRWEYEGVDFEPGGKDHSAAGSSRDTGKEIVEEIYDRKAPVYQMYEFVNLKGREGKMSSSSGDVMTPGELLRVYTPHMLRFLFAETKPTRDFDIPLDEDIVTFYDKFDRIEDAYFNPGEVDNDRKREHWKRVYELSMVEVPEEKPVRISFDHAAFVAQTVPRERWETEGLEKLRETGHVEEGLSDEQEQFVLDRLERALNWSRDFAPEEYVYRFNEEVPGEVVEELSDEQLEAVKDLREMLEEEDYGSSEELEDDLFELARSSGTDVGEFFTAAYLALLSREDGPRLADFILTRGQDEVLNVLRGID
ncbi:MAG: lysine--tRNA ligase [Candidatus Nanohaloarchaea archaeon]|nr:lysine--tRNA ligase [Candidatus Nanohaloarchaea archaeon]